jgi:hypothetical protein
MWPGVPFSCGNNGWMWPDVAVCLWSLAPRLAPRNLVSGANVRTIRTWMPLLSAFGDLRIARRSGIPIMRPPAIIASIEGGRDRTVSTEHPQP